MTKMIFEPQAKLLWYGDRVYNWLESGKTEPILIEIAPVGYCNATCPWCFFKDQRDKEAIKKDVMLAAIRDLAYLGLQAINWTGGGEPVLHPNFEEFVETAANYGLKQGLFTNGYKTIPQQDKFSWIRVSLTEKGFSVIKRPKVSFGICLNQVEGISDDELKTICKKAKKFGASYFQVRPALIGNYKQQPKLNTPDFLLDCATKNFKVYVTNYKYQESVKPKDYKDCYGYHFCPSIDWKGHLSACLYLTLKTDYILGNLNKESLPEIWKRLPDKVKVISKCQNCCKNHSINKLLARAKQVNDIEFL